MNKIGKITDSKTNEPLFGANVFISDKNGKLLSGNPSHGSATDPDGNYSLTDVDSDDYITISSIGYETAIFRVGYDEKMNYGLLPKTTQLEGFTITEERYNPPTPSIARKDRNFKPYIIGGIVVLSLVGGYITYRLLTK